MGAYQPLVAPPASANNHLALAQQQPTQQQQQQQQHQAAQSQLQPQAMAFSSSSLVRTVNPGDRVNIPCSLANMGGSIQFAKDDQPIILDSGCVHCQLDISNDGQASLTINRVSSKDQGHWQCWRLDANGKVKQKIPIIQLVITNSPELPILIVNDKELLGGNNLDATITVKENELVSFKCLIKGASSPVDYVHWMLDSTQNVTQLSQLMMEYSTQENNYLTQSILKLNATKSMNLKSISCLSNHQLWLTPMTVTAFLNVLYEPSFTISREPGFGIPVSEGMTVILKCEIDSNPSSAPIWIKDADNKTSPTAASNQVASSSPSNSNGLLTNGQQTVTGKEAVGEPIVLDTQEDGSVNFQPAQRADSGWYRCKTENKYGNFSSFGYYLNVRGSTANAPAQLITTPPTTATALPRYLANPNPPQPRVLAPNQLPMIGANLASRQLAATSANGNGIGNNHFINSNIMNNDQPSMGSSAAQNVAYPPPMMPFNPSTPPLNLQQETQGNAALCKNNRPDGFPEIEHPIATVSAVLGRPLVLPLRFCCNPGPARVFWIHRHLALTPGRMFGPYITRDIYTAHNSFYCYESTFEIESVKADDIGTAYVFVSNEKGHAGAQIQIQLAKEHHNTLGSRFSLSGQPPSSLSAATPLMNLSSSIFAIIVPLLIMLHIARTTTTITITELKFTQSDNR